MKLTPREKDKLLISMAAEVARKRLQRGCNREQRPPLNCDHQARRDTALRRNTELLPWRHTLLLDYVDAGVSILRRRHPRQGGRGSIGTRDDDGTRHHGCRHVHAKKLDSAYR